MVVDASRVVWMIIFSFGFFAAGAVVSSALVVSSSCAGSFGSVDAGVNWFL